MADPSSSHEAADRSTSNQIHHLGRALLLQMQMFVHDSALSLAVTELVPQHLPCSSIYRSPDEDQLNSVSTFSIFSPFSPSFHPELSQPFLPSSKPPLPPLLRPAHLSLPSLMFLPSLTVLLHRRWPAWLSAPLPTHTGFYLICPYNRRE